MIALPRPLPRLLATASSLQIVAECPPSAVLPHVRHPVGPPAVRGTGIHAFLEQVSAVGRDEALLLIADLVLRAFCEKIDLARLPIGSGFIPEVALAWDWSRDVGRELGRGIDRNYEGLADTEIAGTADVIGLNEPDVVDVLDFKTGRLRVASARANWQLAFLGLAAARTYGRSRVRVSLVYILEDGGSWCDWHEWDAAELEEIAGRLSGIVEAAYLATGLVPGGPVAPTFRTGPHCEYCPARYACPARIDFVRRLLAEPGAIVATAGDPRQMTESIARDVYARAKLAQGAAQQVIDMIFAIAADQGGIDLGNGKRLGPVFSTREELVGDIARAVLVEKFGEDVAVKAAKYKVTKEALEGAVREVAKERGTKIAPLVRETYDSIRAANGIAVKHSSPVKEHDAK